MNALLDYTPPSTGTYYVSASSFSSHTGTYTLFANMAPPILIDLDGDGLAVMGLETSTALFDMDDDGQPDRTAWVDSDDGILALDLNDDGMITQRSEIVFTDHAPEASSDLEALRLAFDSDGDFQLTEYDDRWYDFGVWQDMDSDGYADEGEFYSLEEMDIFAIDLRKEEVTGSNDSHPPFGIHLFGTSEVYFTDGSTTTAWDVGLGYISPSDFDFGFQFTDSEQP